MSNLFAGVDLGGTSIKCVVGDANGKILHRKTIATDSHEGPDVVLRRTANCINELTQEAGKSPDHLGIGVPGLIDQAKGITRYLPNLTTHWIDVPVADILFQQLNCPVRLLNDVRMATLGELVYGRGQNVESMVFIAIGTGIGGGVVLNGKLRLGTFGAAGELGHQTIMPNGPPCGCGNHGCLETLASGTALAASGIRLMLMGLAPGLYDLIDGDTNRVTAEIMAQAARLDEPVKDAILQAADFLAVGIANTMVTVQPDLVVIGGGVANMGDLLFDRLRTQVRQRVSMVPADSIRIEPSELGSDAGVKGAIALAADRL